MQTTKIDLSDKEAVLFIAFQKHHDLFVDIFKAGVFAIHNGEAILNFDQDGTLTQVDVNYVRYKKGYPLIKN